MWSILCWSFFFPANREEDFASCTIVYCVQREMVSPSQFAQQEEEQQQRSSCCCCCCPPVHMFAYRFLRIDWGPRKKCISGSQASSMFSVQILSFTPQFLRRRPSRNTGCAWGHVALSSFEISNEILRSDHWLSLVATYVLKILALSDKNIIKNLVSKFPGSAVVSIGLIAFLPSGTM